MKTDIVYKKENYSIRIAKAENMNEYILSMVSCDEEIDYFTGTNEKFTNAQIETYYKNCLVDKNRYDFLIFDNEKLIGEVVLNEIDYDVKSANFRICLFKTDSFNKGIGLFATKSALNFAFSSLKLQRVGLEVFSFNKRAIKVYKKAGFIKEGRLRNAIKDKNEYADIICMSILKCEYNEI